MGGRGIQVIAENLEGVSVPVSAGRTVDVVLRGPKDGCPKTVRGDADAAGALGTVGRPPGTG